MVMKKKKGDLGKTVVLMIFAVVLIIAFYFFLNNTKGGKKEEKEPSNEIDILIAKDLDSDYPASAREVVKLYSRIITNFYREKLSDDKLDALLLQARKLYDPEFLVSNPEEEQRKKLVEERNEYLKLKKSIINHAVQEQSYIEKKTQDGVESATVYTVYALKDKNGMTRVIEEYLLRRLENEDWKIVGWKEKDKLPPDMEVEN